MEEASTSPPPLEPPEGEPKTGRFRWWIHLLVLTAYPVASGLVAVGLRTGKAQPLLPTNVSLLLAAVGVELLLFGMVFGLAWLASRATVEQLLLRWRGGIGPVLRGFIYAIGLRVTVLLALVFIAVVLAIASGGNFQKIDQLRPEVENLVNAQGLLKNPAYLWLNLTLVSFVLAGFREELWRAGMLAGLAALFPGRLGAAPAQMVAVFFAAVIFGFGHISQGAGGVVMSTVLGMGLGAIMVFQRSIWEAVIAHGFFNATSFALLYGIERWQPGWIPGGGF